MASGLIQIDLYGLLRQRLGRKGRLLPHWAVRPLEKLIRQERMNDILRELYPLEGADFCKALLRKLNISLEVRNRENMPADSRCVFTCNHPLGGLDGICLLAFLQDAYPETKPYAVVNDLLMAVAPLASNFLPVNKHGAQRRQYAEQVDSAFDGQSPILYFPAGLVSRLQPDGTVADLEWKKYVVNKAVQTGRPVVPLFFDGLNKGSFYRLAQRRKRLGLKFNIEMALLPREMFLSEGTTFTIYVGTPVAPSDLRGGAHAEQEAQQLRLRTYALANNPTTGKL